MLSLQGEYGTRKSLQCLNGVRGPLDGHGLAPRRTRQNLKAGSCSRWRGSIGRVGDAAKTMQARVEGMIGDELDLVEAELAWVGKRSLKTNCNDGNLPRERDDWCDDWCNVRMFA
jgi:hypothetical protein